MCCKCITEKLITTTNVFHEHLKDSVYKENKTIPSYYFSPSKKKKNGFVYPYMLHSTNGIEENKTETLQKFL